MLSQYYVAATPLSEVWEVPELQTQLRKMLIEALTSEYPSIKKIEEREVSCPDSCEVGEPHYHVLATGGVDA